MKTSVEKLEGNRVKLTVTLSAEEVDRQITAAYGRVASKVRIPGFRSGKAPRPIIDTHVGRETVLADALEELVEESYPKALEAENLRPIERPDVGTLDSLEAGQEYSFSAEFDVRPHLTLTSTAGLSVTVPPSNTEDREVEAQIDYLRERFASLQPVEDRGVEPKDFALISFVGTVDGEAYEENTVDKYLYELGTGQMPKEFDEAMVGAKPGDEVRAEFSIPDTSSNPEYVGKTAGFDITVHEIKAKALPEADDEFAANVGGFDTIAALRDDIRSKMDESKHEAHVRLVERAAREALAERLVGDVPEQLVTSKTNEMAEDFVEGLQRQGYSMEQYLQATGVTVEQIQEDIAREAANRVREELALEALFRDQGMELTEADMVEELSTIAETEGTTVDAIEGRLRSAGLLPLVGERIMHHRAVRWLMDNVEVVEKSADEAGTGAAAGKAAKTGKKGTSTKKKAAEKDTEAETSNEEA